MTKEQFLYETINTQKEVIRKYKPDILDISQEITSNLKYDFFDWQKSTRKFFSFGIGKVRTGYF